MRPSEAEVVVAGLQSRLSIAQVCSAYGGLSDTNGRA
ncbi:hypothetical protein F4557_001914 [Actinomadura catellatispora]|uniref:Uncharacterized protein n=1 Tax=Actinomadura livida TaxID=79909 RepID=A0A7W7MWA1_9ACTN|nr:hypothetical protein [Actinomadura catellatispora]